MVLWPLAAWTRAQPNRGFRGARVMRAPRSLPLRQLGLRDAADEPMWLERSMIAVTISTKMSFDDSPPDWTKEYANVVQGATSQPSVGTHQVSNAMLSRSVD